VRIPVLTVTLLAALPGCGGQVAPSASDTALVPIQTPQNCRDFTAQVTVEGQPRQAVGQTCRQPDGSWQITANTPGLPQQVYSLPPQAITLYPYAEPFYWWDPWFYGVSSPLFLVRGSHHHDFPHGGASHHGGSHHGGSHGGRK